MATDHDAIATLVYAYAERLDSGDFERVAQLFANATLHTDGYPDVRRGSAQVLETYRAKVILYEGTPCTKHVTTNLVIDVDEAAGTATARSYFSVLQARPQLPLQIIVAGRYRDRFAGVDAAWHFTERVICVDLVGDLRFHLRDGALTTP